MWSIVNIIKLFILKCVKSFYHSYKCKYFHLEAVKISLCGQNGKMEIEIHIYTYNI